MSKICPNCKREIDENEKFCPFCASFTGETPEEKKKSPVGAIIGGAAGVLALGAASLAVFVFDIFGMYGDKTETFYGTGDKLFIQSVTPVCIDGKWGYADKDGKTTLKPQYTAAYAFNENINDVAPVAVDGKFGYIKKDGEFVTEPQYSFAGSFSDKGLAKAVNTDGKTVFVDSRGRKAFDGRMFDYASDMNDSGYAFAYTLLMPEITSGTEGFNSYDIIYSLLSSDGKITELENFTGISAVYDDKYIGFKPKNTAYYEYDSAKVYAVFSTDGTALTDYYDYIVRSGELFIALYNSDNDKSAVYNAKLLKADTLEQVGGEYLCTTDVKTYDSGAVLLKRDDKGFIREVLLDDNANEVYLCSTGSHIVSGFDMSGYACVYEKGKYCGYTVNGKQFESDCQFGEFNCGLAPYYDDAKIGYINTAGDKVINAQYDGASGYYADGYAYIKSGNEYSVIDMSGNTVIGKLGYASDKLMFADTVHDWYDPEDFEKFDGENMFTGDFYYIGNTADMGASIYDKSETQLIKERMMIESKNSDTEIASLYRRTDSGRLGNDGYLLTHKVNMLTRQLMSPDGKINETEMDCANGIRIGSAPVIRYKDETVTYLADIFGNRYAVSGYNRINSDDCTVLDFRNTEYISRQFFVYDDNFIPSFVLRSDNPMNIHSKGNLLFIKNIKYAGGESHNAVIDRKNGRTLYTYNEVEFIGEYFIKGRHNEEGSYVISTSCGVEIGAYPYAKAYDDRLLCFDYDKYYLYDRYANLLGEYETRPKISAYNGNIVLKNEDGTYTCYDRDMNVLLTTKYDIQPIENGYCSFADNEKGKIGFLFADGKEAIEPKYDCVTEMTPDGYFVSKTISRSEIAYDTADIDYTVAIEDKDGNAVVEKTQNVCDIANSAFDGKSLYGYFDGYRYYADKFAGYENVTFGDIQMLPQSYYGYTLTDFYGNELFEEYNVTDFTPTQINGDMLCVATVYYDDNEYPGYILLNLNGDRLYYNDRRLKLIGDNYIVGISDNGEPADLYNTDGSVMLTLKDIKDPDGISEINIVGNRVLVKSYTESAVVYDKTTGEILYKPDTDGSNVDFIYENLIKTDVYDEAAGGWSNIFIDLDTQKSFELQDHVIFRRLYNADGDYENQKAEYPLMCCAFSYSPNQMNYLYPALLELKVYQIDENAEVKLLRTYSSDDGILYMVDDYNSGSGLCAYIDEHIDDPAVRNIRLVNVWNENERYFENVSEFSVQNNEVRIGIYDENGKRTAYKLSTDLETADRVE